jgi:hypothetical protein
VTVRIKKLCGNMLSRLTLNKEQFSKTLDIVTGFLQRNLVSTETCPKITSAEFLFSNSRS